MAGPRLVVLGVVIVVDLAVPHVHGVRQGSGGGGEVAGAVNVLALVAVGVVAPLASCRPYVRSLAYFVGPDERGDLMLGSIRVVLLEGCAEDGCCGGGIEGRDGNSC